MDIKEKIKISKEDYTILTQDFGLHPCKTCKVGTLGCVGICWEVHEYEDRFKVLPENIRPLARYYNGIYLLDKQIDDLESYVETLKRTREKIIKEVNEQLIVEEKE